MIDYKIIPCKRIEIKDFIEKYHYSKSINGLHSSFCFKLLDGTRIIGAIIYGKIGMANVWKKYAKHESDVLELNRLCCIDDTKKNTESYFISKTLKWLKINSKIKIIISYADPEYNHTGVIYKATHFKLIGKTNNGKVIIYNNKKYHDKTIRTKNNGKLKPYAERIKNALDNGEAYYKHTTGKFIYLYELRNSRYRRSSNKSLNKEKLNYVKASRLYHV